MGRRPYPGLNRKEYKERLLSTLVQVSNNDKPNDWSDESRDIINSLLVRKEHMRLGHKGAQSVKDHAWFRDIDWEMLLQQKVPPPFLPASVRFLLMTSYRLMKILMKLIWNRMKKTRD